MAAVPTIPTFTSSTVVPSSNLAALAAALTFAQNPPACALRQSAATTLTTAVWAAVNFDLSDEDNVNGHSTTVNNTRYTAQYAGWYMCSGGALFAANVTGTRQVRWAVNGTPYNGGLPVSVQQAVSTAASGTGVPAQTQRLFLNVGDFVELQAFQNSGGNLTVNNCLMSIVWAGVS